MKKIGLCSETFEDKPNNNMANVKVKQIVRMVIAMVTAGNLQGCWYYFMDELYGGNMDESFGMDSNSMVDIDNNRADERDLVFVENVERVERPSGAVQRTMGFTCPHYENANSSRRTSGTS